LKELAGELRWDVRSFATRLRALSEEEANFRRAPGKWTRKEIVGHLIDSAFNNHQRFVRAQGTTRFEWPGYQQERWVVVHRYHERPFVDLVDLWAAANDHLAYVIEALPVEARAIPCVIGGKEATLEWWVTDYLAHLRHHLEQVFEPEP
jgi:hypothetical protein